MRRKQQGHCTHEEEAAETLHTGGSSRDIAHRRKQQRHCTQEDTRHLHDRLGSQPRPAHRRVRASETLHTGEEASEPVPRRTQQRIAHGGSSRDIAPEEEAAETLHTVGKHHISPPPPPTPPPHTPISARQPASPHEQRPRPQMHPHEPASRPHKGKKSSKRCNR
ncbi:hypothetical protein FKM82_028566, partial [Ascaphus truei]